MLFYFSPEEGAKALITFLLTWFTLWDNYLHTLNLYLCSFCCVNEQNDMTRVSLHWNELLMPLLQKYKLNITWGDQDLINIIFHYNPGRHFLHEVTFYSFKAFNV